LVDLHHQGGLQGSKAPKKKEGSPHIRGKGTIILGKRASIGKRSCPEGRNNDPKRENDYLAVLVSPRALRID